jgi:AcrR family transcriptional regulator
MRRMAKGETTRMAILDRAVPLASLRGLNGLTIGDLAAELGMSKSGLYAHFGSKEALQLALIDRVFSAFEREVAAPALARPDGPEQLRALLDGWVAWSCAEGHPGGCPMLAAVMDADAEPGAVRDRLAEGWGLWRKTVRRAAERAGVADPEAVAQAIFGLYLEQHVQHWLMGDKTAPDAARRALAERLQAA